MLRRSYSVVSVVSMTGSAFLAGAALARGLLAAFALVVVVFVAGPRFVITPTASVARFCSGHLDQGPAAQA